MGARVLTRTLSIRSYPSRKLFEIWEVLDSTALPALTFVGQNRLSWISTNYGSFL